mmetsp:Transcript_32916/g.75801  ORF Transcript_32916/g.75801 Transcript_32916/m.75801 type:complete len:239 (+) Transcript_32916:380-1096(+)
MTNRSIGIGLLSLSMCLSHVPFSSIFPSITPRTSTLSMVLSLTPFSRVDRSIRKAVRAMSLVLSVPEFSLVAGTIGPRVDTASLTLVGKESTRVDSSIVPLVRAGPVTLIVAIDPIVGIAIRKCGLAVSVPTSLRPFANVNTAVIVLHRALLVGLVLVDLTGVDTRITIRIDHLLLAHVMPRQGTQLLLQNGNFLAFQCQQSLQLVDCHFLQLIHLGRTTNGNFRRHPLYVASTRQSQ